MDSGVRNPPEKYVIGPDGTILANIMGPTTAAALDALVHQAQGQ